MRLVVCGVQRAVYQVCDPPWSNSDHLICALKVVANPHADVDSFGHCNVSRSCRRRHDQGHRSPEKIHRGG